MYICREKYVILLFKIMPPRKGKMSRATEHLASEAYLGKQSSLFNMLHCFYLFSMQMWLTCRCVNPEEILFLIKKF